jgi:predicted small integral membrane protein
MTDPIGLALVVTLAGIGLIHLAWALGMNWPGTDPVWSAIAVCFFAAVGVV